MKNVFHVAQKLVYILTRDSEMSLLGIVQLPRLPVHGEIGYGSGHDSSKYLKLRGVICPIERYAVDSNTYCDLLCLHRCLPAVVDDGPCVAGLGSQFTFNLQKAVVLCNALAAAG